MPIRNILYLLIQILDVAPAHEHLGGVAVVVVEEDAVTHVERLDLLHVSFFSMSPSLVKMMRP